MAQLEAASVDAVVTDPPYSMSLMGRASGWHEDEDSGFGYYLSGLIDGEGSFRVDAKVRRCEFSMKLRADDEWILHRAAAFIGHGRIGHEPVEGGAVHRKRGSWSTRKRMGSPRSVRAPAALSATGEEAAGLPDVG